SRTFLTKGSILKCMSKAFRRDSSKRRCGGRMECRSRRRNCCACPTALFATTCRSTTFRRRSVLRIDLLDDARPDWKNGFPGELHSGSDAARGKLETVSGDFVEYRSFESAIFPDDGPDSV